MELFGRIGPHRRWTGSMWLVHGSTAYIKPRPSVSGSTVRILFGRTGTRERDLSLWRHHGAPVSSPVTAKLGLWCMDRWSLHRKMEWRLSARLPINSWWLELLHESQWRCRVLSSLSGHRAAAPWVLRWRNGIMQWRCPLSDLVMLFNRCGRWQKIIF
jgi:hypothetical protein